MKKYKIEKSETISMLSTFNNIDMQTCSTNFPYFMEKTSGSLIFQPHKEKKKIKKEIFLYNNLNSSKYNKFLPCLKGCIAIPNGKEGFYISKKIKDDNFLDIKKLESKFEYEEEKKNKFHFKKNGFYFQNSLFQRNLEIRKNAKNFKGINKIKPVVKEKYRKKELKEITKSFLIANNNQASDVNNKNKLMLGYHTSDLFNFSKFTNPTMIEKSIINEKNNNYKLIQQNFTETQNSFNKMDNNNKKMVFFSKSTINQNSNDPLNDNYKFTTIKKEIVPRKHKNNSRNNENSNSYEKNIQTKKYEKNLSLKKIHFKRNQISNIPLTDDAIKNKTIGEMIKN